MLRKRLIETSFRSSCQIAFVLSVILVSPPMARAESIHTKFSCGESVAEAKAKSLITRVEKTYSKVSTLEANFTQDSYFLGLDRSEVSNGKLSFKKPGRMDWDYLKPRPQRFVSNGDTLSFYQPELNQVTIAKFSNSFNSSVPVSFLLGLGKFDENFRLTAACKNSSGVLLALESKIADPSLSEFFLLTREKDAFPLGAKIVDVGGNETSIFFKDISVNSKIKDSHFEFEVPRGVDVIDQT